MKITRIDNSDTSVFAWLAGMFLLLGACCAIAIATRSAKIVFLLSLPLYTWLTGKLSEEGKVRALLLSIPLSLVHIPRLPIPYGTSISEIILLSLLIDELFFSTDDPKKSMKPVNVAGMVLLGLFCLSGFFANFTEGNLSTWNAYCLTPLIIFYLLSQKIHNSEDAWLFIKVSLLTIVGFLALLKLASWLGHYSEYDPLGTEADLGSNYRAADGMLIKFGPIQHILFATRLGAIAALGLPGSILLFLKKKGFDWLKAGLLLMIIILGYSIILSATRGSFVAAMAGISLVILLSGRFRLRMLLLYAVLSVFALLLAGDVLLHLFPEENIQRLSTLSKGVQEIDNYHQRMNVLTLAWDLTVQHPLGVGFGYLFHNYEIDDAIIYAIILQGTGILGTAAFILLVVYLAIKFMLGVFKSRSESIRDFAAVGISTLATGLLAGVSSQSILFEPVHAFVFWMLILVCFRMVSSHSFSRES